MVVILLRKNENLLFKVINETELMNVKKVSIINTAITYFRQKLGINNNLTENRGLKRDTVPVPNRNMNVPHSLPRPSWKIASEFITLAISSQKTYQIMFTTFPNRMVTIK